MPVTYADYAWFETLESTPLFEASCLTFVRELDVPELLHRFGVRAETVRSMPLAEALELPTEYPERAVVAAHDVPGGVVAVEHHGCLGTLSPVQRAVSAGTEAVAVFRAVSALGRVVHAVDGEVRTEFEQLMPDYRFGTAPDALLPLMLEVGLDPDGGDALIDHCDSGALALAERLTGLRLLPEHLAGEAVTTAGVVEPDRHGTVVG